jgi:sugar phosphate isomerase/epimerase
MQLGFVSAILGDLNLQEVLAFAANAEFDCVELMCWPPGSSDRRYGGVCHVDVVNFSDDEAHRIRDLVHTHNVKISSLGYYPNPLDPDPGHRHFVIGHLKKVIAAAPKLDVKIVNTFIGRDWTRSFEDNWPMFQSLWPDIVRFAEAHGVTLGLENCPMLFSKHEWPGGKNLAGTPRAWRAIFEAIPSQNLGLNFDPSHLIWQFIDTARCVREFGNRIVHVHAKDTRIDADKLYEVGINGQGWHIAKLPGLGQVDWSAMFAALTDAGYDGAVCIEVEDKAFEGSLQDRQRALRQSQQFLKQWVSG